MAEPTAGRRAELLGPTWLFCPADRPERFAKAAEQADAVIIDLEEGVAPADRPRARAALIDMPLDPEGTVVRINPSGTSEHDADLSALRQWRPAIVAAAPPTYWDTP